MKYFFCFLLTVWLPLSLAAQDSTDIQTYTFAVKGNDTLQLDIYETPTTKSKASNPCIIYVFGGGFMAGSRNDSLAVVALKELAAKGYVIAAIDYRLGLKPLYEASKNGNNKNQKSGLAAFRAFMNTFDHAINMATEDLYDATTFLADNHARFHIDPKMMIPLGSSAGAITSLHAVYHIANADTIATRHLPPGFNYAGAISMAGAIFSVNGAPKWQHAPCPILFFHGDADRNVPYNELKLKILFYTFKYRFCGPKYLTPQLDKLQSPYTFFTFANREHEMSYLPLIHNQESMDFFIKNTVIGHNQTTTNLTQQDLTLPEKKKNLSIKDFLSGNGLK